MDQLLKLVHVLAVIIFLGNIITGLFWKAHADRTLSLCTGMCKRNCGCPPPV